MRFSLNSQIRFIQVVVFHDSGHDTSSSLASVNNQL